MYSTYCQLHHQSINPTILPTDTAKSSEQDISLPQQRRPCLSHTSVAEVENEIRRLKLKNQGWGPYRTNNASPQGSAEDLRQGYFGAGGSYGGGNGSNGGGVQADVVSPGGMIRSGAWEVQSPKVEGM